MLKGNAEKCTVYENQSEVWTSFIRGGDLKKTFDGCIKNNNGFYKSSKHSEWVDNMITAYGTAFSVEVHDYDLEELDLQPLKTQQMVIVGGRFRPKGQKDVPICSVYLVDYQGVVEHYKCKFVATDSRRRLCDYILDDVILQWKRKVS